MGRPVLLACLAAVAGNTGCLAVYSTRPVDIVVTRTDTGEPAAGAPVKASYASMFVLNQPPDAEGVTDPAGRVTLRMADFLSGPILTAGGTQYWAPSEVIRVGGPLVYKPSANPHEPVPTHAVRLVPRRRSLADRLLGRDGQPGVAPPP